VEQRRKPMDARQKRFVLEYVQDCNAAAAAQRAGYSQRTARNAGYRLLQRADVQEAVAQAQAEIERGLIDSAEQVRRDLVRYCAGAEDDRNWSAIGKLMELRCKVEGLLVDRHRVEGADGSIPTIVLRWADS